MSRKTYRDEITEGRKRLNQAVGRASARGWEVARDEHKPGVFEYSIWDETDGGYIAETVLDKPNAEYIVMTDSGFGERVVDLFAALLASDAHDLDTQEQHETCPRGDCLIGAAVDLARYINSRDSSGVRREEG